jgi:hypothetical protein
MREATIQRPVTVAKLAEVLVTKPYRILSALIRRSVFPAPCDSIDDSVAMEVASLAGVDLKIIDDEDGGASECAESPDVPVPPPNSSSASDRIQEAQQVVAPNGP